MARAEGVGLTQHTIRRSWLGAPAIRPRLRLRPLPAAARPAHGQPRRQARRAAARLDHGLRRRHDRLAPRADDLRLAYCDHVVLYRFTPRGLRDTDCEITWLVNGDAVEGKDYDLAGPDLALGRHDDRGQGDHRAQPGGRGLALLRARPAVAVDGAVHATVPRLVRRRDATHYGRRIAGSPAGR